MVVARSLSLPVVGYQPSPVGLLLQVDRPEIILLDAWKTARFVEGAQDRGGVAVGADLPAMQSRERRPRRRASVPGRHHERSGGLEVSDGGGHVLVVERIEPRQRGLLGGLILIQRSCRDAG